jgi:predicted kinase
MNDSFLVLISGLPGTGKTVLARKISKRLQIPLFSKDRLQSVLREHDLADRSTADGYFLILDLADEQLDLGVSAVLDGVFPMGGFRSAAREIAERNNTKFLPIFCYCSDVSIWNDRMKDREQYVPNWTPVDWSKVERIQSIYEPWDPLTTLFVDAVEGLDKNLEQVLSWIRS